MTNSLTDLEEEILGSCLLTPGAINQVVTLIPRKEVFSGEYALIYEQMLKLQAANNQTDLITLNFHLTREHGATTSAKQPWMMVLTSLVPAGKRSTGNLLHKCGLLQQERTRLNLTTKLSEFLVEAQDVTTDPLQLIDSVRRYLDKTSSDLSELSERNFSDVLHEVVDRAEKAAVSGNPITGIASKLPEFDSFIKGFQPKTLTVMAARPSMGKTAVACQIAYNVAYEQKIPVAFFSLEMGAEQLAGRLLALDTSIKNSHVTAGVNAWGEPVNIDKLRNSANRQGKAPFNVYDKLRTLPQIKARISQLVSRYGSELLVIIDYLQLVKTGTKVDLDRTACVSEVSRELKECANTYGIPILALGQLSREVEKRPNKRPQLSDLNHSGSIEQDADTVSFLFRPGYYSKQDENGLPIDDNLLAIIIPKNRNGSTHVDSEAISMHYDRSTNQVTPYQSQQSFQSVSNQYIA